jgi:uncharacterized membrane-anchored protein YhcB (DUF1043 family)
VNSFSTIQAFWSVVAICFVASGIYGSIKMRRLNKAAKKLDADFQADMERSKNLTSELGQQKAKDTPDPKR